MAVEELELTIEITCTRLPGLRWGDRGPMHLGIQNGEDLIDAAPADREKIVFHPELRVRPHTDGSATFLGPFAHGPRAERFIYLIWAIVDKRAVAERTGRIKLHLSHLKWRDVQNAVMRKKPIKVTLELTDAKGKPVHASVRADIAKWSL